MMKYVLMTLALMVSVSVASAQSIVTPAGLDQMCATPHDIEFQKCKKDLVVSGKVTVVSPEHMTPELKKIIEDHFWLQLRTIRVGDIEKQ
jgi:hypothetical protein